MNISLLSTKIARALIYKNEIGIEKPCHQGQAIKKVTRYPKREPYKAENLGDKITLQKHCGGKKKKRAREKRAARPRLQKPREEARKRMRLSWKQASHSMGRSLLSAIQNSQEAEEKKGKKEHQLRTLGGQ